MNSAVLWSLTSQSITSTPWVPAYSKPRTSPNNSSPPTTTFRPVPQPAMRGDVDKPAVRTLLAEHFQGGFGAGENFRVGKHGRDSLYLIQDVRGGGIGNPQDQGARVRRR